MARAPYIPVGERKAAEIIALDSAFSHVPAPSLPLKGPAYDEYVKCATRLQQAGKLNIHTQAICEQIGVFHGENYKRIERGQTISSASLDKLGRLRAQIKLIDESDAAAPQSGAEENRFARYGVILRRGAEKAAIRPS